MSHLASVGTWMIFECSQTAGEMLRVAYDTECGTWHHLCDSANYGWDPDPMIPQFVIEVHFRKTEKKESLS